MKWSLPEFLEIFAATALATTLVIFAYSRVAHRVGLLAPPGPFHDRPVAQSGGAALWLVIAGAFFALGLERDPLALRILLASLVLACVGWIDDRWALQPAIKLVAQFFVSVALLSGSFADRPRLHLAIALPLGVVWLVGQSNAVNILDNMDGACALLLAMSAIAIALVQLAVGAPTLALFSTTIAAAVLGFWVWNRKPARVFLGDTGSLSLGLALAAIAMNGSWFGEGARLSRTLLPPLLMAVPVLNTAFVILTRFDSGIPVSRGLADHINYRLVAHGWTIGQSLLILVGLGAMGGLLAVSWFFIPLTWWCVLTALFVLCTVYFGVFLSHADVKQMYLRLGVNPENRPPSPAAYRIRRRLAFEVCSDAIVASASFFFAFQLRFDGLIPPSQEVNLLRGLPLAVAISVAAAWGNGLYRSFWKYVGLQEMLRIVVAAAVAGILFATVALLSTEFTTFPRSIYVLYPLLFGVLAAGPRLSLRLMHQWREVRRGPDRQIALIVGAGDAGELALRLHRQAKPQQILVRGFLDDNPEKIGLQIHGVPVLGPTSALENLCGTLGARLLIVAIPSAPPERIAAVVRAARNAGLETRCFPEAPSPLQIGPGEALAPAALPGA